MQLSLFPDPLAKSAAVAAPIDPVIAAIAERIVEARCLERGLVVTRPSVDIVGVDLVVSGLRVQVKSTRQPRPLGRREKTARYAFNFSSRKAHRVIDRAQQCDVFAFYAHDSGRLWLLASDEVANRYPTSTVAYMDPLDQRGLDDFGLFRRCGGGGAQ